MLRKVEMLTQKGFLEMVFHKLDEAESSYNRALKITIKLERAIPGEIKSDQLKLLSSLAWLLIAKNHFQRAINLSEKAIEIYREIREPSLESMAEYGKALRCSGWANLYRSSTTRSIDAARANFRTALALYSKLAHVDPTKYTPLVVKCLTDMSYVFGKPEAVEAFLLEALELSRKESLRNPEVNLPILCSCLELYGGFMNNTKNNYYQNFHNYLSRWFDVLILKPPDNIVYFKKYYFLK